LKVPLWLCAVIMRRFPSGCKSTRRPLQPEATGAVMEVTKGLKPLVKCATNRWRLGHLRMPDKVRKLRSAFGASRMLNYS
jgi:hypothetical protein